MATEDPVISLAVEISIGGYIVHRLEGLGVKDPGITWVGQCNELTAAYAADGYARYIRGLGVVATTVGVGELSAIKGIAGCFAEEVPVLHIVGQQDTGVQKKGRNVIHTLGGGRYDEFTKSALPYTCSQFLLCQRDIDLCVAGALVDQVLSIALASPVQRI